MVNSLSRVQFSDLPGTSTAGPFPKSTLIMSILQQQAQIRASWNMTDAKLQELVRAYGSRQLYAQYFDETQDPNAHQCH